MGTAGTVVTYGQLDQRSNRLARLLRDAGLRRGDRLAVLMENNPRYLEITWAALRSGLYITPVNRHLTPAEVSYIIDDCGARALVVSVALNVTVTGLASDVVARIPVRLALDGPVDGFERYEDAIDLWSPERLADERSGAYLFYSSGTTGRPKGVVQPLPDACPATRQPRVLGLADLYGYREGMRYLSPA